MKDNIYDIIITELILGAAAGATSAVGAPTVTLTSTANTEVSELFSSNGTFTSTVTNIPTGYSVKASTHIITTPTAPVTTTGSTSLLTTTSHAIVLGTVGSTFVVNTTVTLEHTSDPDIVLVDTFTITSVLPIYYGVKLYSATPVIAGLSTTAMSDTVFSLTSSSVGRIVLALPVSLPALVSLTGPNGLVYTVANDFTVITVGSLDFYQLTYDTQLTGTNIKIFTLNY